MQTELDGLKDQAMAAQDEALGSRVSAMDDAEREAFAHAANGSVALRMTPAEQALADGRHLTPDVGTSPRAAS